MFKYYQIDKFYLTTRVDTKGKCYLLGVFKKVDDKNFTFTFNTKVEPRKLTRVLGKSVTDGKVLQTDKVVEMFKYFMIPPTHPDYSEWCSQSGINPETDSLWNQLERTYLLYEELYANQTYKDSYNVDRGNFMFWKVEPSFCVEEW